MENYQKSKKLGTFYKFLHILRAYFCLIFTSFWKKLIFAPPGGGGFRPEYLTLLTSWHILNFSSYNCIINPFSFFCYLPLP